MGRIRESVRVYDQGRRQTGAKSDGEHQDFSRMSCLTVIGVALDSSGAERMTLADYRALLESGKT